MSIEERLSTLHFTVDETPHIVVDGDRCRPCGTHSCLTFCPAQCFTAKDEGGISYYHVGCLECGTCLLLCAGEAITWSYPKGGYGISYRF
jgi:ferredoxin like protein